MRKLLLFLLLFGLLLPARLAAHPFNAASYVIVDTDGGIDDYRALCLLLSAPDIRVIAVTASTGVLPARTVAVKARALLNQLHHEGIPVAVNEDGLQNTKGCSPALGFEWGVESAVNQFNIISLDSLGTWLSMHFRKKITWISLGSLSTVIRLHEIFPALSQYDAQIIWSSEALHPFSGFNHRIDTSLVAKLHVLPVAVTIVQGGGSYPASFAKAIDSVHTTTALAFGRSFGEATAGSPFALRAYDEMSILFLHHRADFEMQAHDKVMLARFAGQQPFTGMVAAVLAEKNMQAFQIVERMPPDPGFYQQDVRQWAAAIMQAHGMQEWVSVVNTFELHRHIGVYALVGAKMGERALEYFGAGIDELAVVSMAGSGPPISCMNDGIQVSTGATLGHGLIKVREDVPQVAAWFTYMGQTIGLRLRESWSRQIKTEIGQLVQQHGLESDRYWEEVRRLALGYWMQMDRHDMFDVVTANAATEGR